MKPLSEGFFSSQTLATDTTSFGILDGILSKFTIDSLSYGASTAEAALFLQVGTDSLPMARDLAVAVATPGDEFKMGANFIDSGRNFVLGKKVEHAK